MIGDRGYDSDPLDERLQREYGIELIAPHRRNRKKPPTQDRRKLKGYKRRHRIERLWAWMKNYRRLALRYEYHVLNFLGMVQLCCVLLLLRHF